jgi:hypothetical protein
MMVFRDRGVEIKTPEQIESQLQQRNYEGFLR